MRTCTAYLDLDEDNEDCELELTLTVFPAEPDVGIFSEQIEITAISGLPDSFPEDNLTRDQLESLMSQALESLD